LELVTRQTEVKELDQHRWYSN